MRTMGYASVATMLVAVMAATFAFGEIYYWDVEPGDWGEYGSVGNWRIGAADGAVATVLPGIDDSLHPSRTLFTDLGGASYELNGWEAEADWSVWNLNMTNGVLRFNGDVYLRHGEVRLYEGAALAFGPKSHFIPGRSSGEPRKIYVNEGAAFEMQGSKLEIYNMRLYIAAGGSGDLTCSSIGVTSGSAQSSLIENQGELVLGNGLVLSTSGASNSKLALTQKSGSLTLGGGISQNGKETQLIVTLEGGSIVVTDDVDVVASSAVIANNAALAVEVASGKHFNISSFTIGSGVSITKGGAGNLQVGPALPESLSIDAGAIECAVANQSYDLSGVAMAEGTEIVLGAGGHCADRRARGSRLLFWCQRQADILPHGAGQQQ